MKRSAAFLLPLLLIAAPALAASNYTYVHRPNADVYFGHISYCDLKNDALDPKVSREEGVETATVNLPLSPGATLLTFAGRRCEAQFDTGTILRLDVSSGVRIETVLARSLTSSGKLTNLVLEHGRLRVMYRDYDSDEVFQVLTDNAAVKLTRASVVDIAWSDGETRVHVAGGSAVVLGGPKANKTEARKLKAGQRLVVRGEEVPGAPEPVATLPSDEFTEWNRTINQRFVELHEGRSDLPKPIYRYPPAVIHFAEKWSSLSGEWVWSSLYGYAWRPYFSRDEGWRPYMHGRWLPVQGRLFWVPDEPWGWVPYHLGLWHWDTKNGWVWIPGSAFAPAWVSFAECDAGYSWRALTLWDWYDPSRPPGSPGSYGYWNAYGASRWFPTRYGGWFGGYDGICGSMWPRADIYALRQARAEYTTPAPAFVPAPEPSPSPAPAPDPDRPLIPFPREVQVAAERAWRAIERGDPEAREALGGGGRGVVDERLVRPERPGDEEQAGRRPSVGAPAAGISEGVAAIDPPQPAASIAWIPPMVADRGIRAPQAAADRSDRPAGPTRGQMGRLPDRSQASNAAPEAGTQTGRFRDWNPDVRAARGQGGHIVYSSERNEVRCDGCRQALVRPAWAHRGEGGSGSSGSGSSSDSGSASGSMGFGSGAAAAGAGNGPGGAAARGDTGAKEKSPQ